MDSVLEISDSCVGCGQCARVCIRRHLIIGDDKKARETESDYSCSRCGHCISVCPKGSIAFRDGSGNQAMISGSPVSPEDLAELFRERRSRRWFDRNCTREELEALFSAVRYSPTAENSQAIQFAVVDGRFSEFMILLADILRPRAGDHPRIRQFADYVDRGQKEKNNPFTWEGRQIIIVFSRLPADALICACQLDLMACSMGLGGFHSRWMLLAAETDPDRFMSFFPGIGKDLKANAVFVTGHPSVKFRTTVPRKEKEVFWMRRRILRITPC